MNSERLEGELARVVAGRPISIVGNARSLLSKSYGSLIDSRCVLRINAGIPVSKKAQGGRTDIHCFNALPNLETNLRNARGKWLRWRHAAPFKQALRVWMNIEKRQFCEDPEQLFYPEQCWHRLAGVLHAPPSTGAMALDMIATFVKGSEVAVYGFDFKDSSTFYRKREKLGDHDWSAERDYAISLCEQRGWQLF